MENSKNQGFAVLDQETRRCKVRFFGKTFIWEPEKPAALPDGLGRMIETVCRDYSLFDSVKSKVAGSVGFR